ncbi:S-methyl-5-thioribose-1-phosphate isomerase [Arabiibacter massiliensis]|uniref:S-methyl-5-thioribose-1-phosphate isomerase n=1 Tax=Arabiibacter massiliensis TaxID=1870985 RepID=UPI0009BB56DA|nr:S-methyl-5-thioribose-1-phosphate isomerase [Arabiibacter massiliensis]
MAATLNLDNLPRTIELGRDGDGRAELAYVDQRLLPGELRIVRTGDWRAVVDAVKTLAVRGAPAIGVAGAAAVALWACNEGAADAAAGGCAQAGPRFLDALARVADEVADARPTAVNLAWGVRRLERLARVCADEGAAPHAIADELFAEARRMEAEDEAANRAIGAHGSALLPQGARILTHCNAGSLATAFYGTALGVVYAAAAEGKVARVYADETRPVGQGARLTAWELARAGVPVTLICDDMAASLMAKGEVDAVVVGADRIAANGDVANKIGTYGVAVLARHHGIPFYVAAPASTIDPACTTGADIPIEERDPAEVLPAPIPGVDVWNPAFDVTPAALITRIVTEHGAFAPPDAARAAMTAR